MGTIFFIFCAVAVVVVLAIVISAARAIVDWRIDSAIKGD
jgi:hypothetical protein